MVSDANSTSVKRVPTVTVNDTESSTSVAQIVRRGTGTSQGTTDVKIMSQQDLHESWRHQDFLSELSGSTTNVKKMERTSTKRSESEVTETEVRQAQEQSEEGTAFLGYQEEGNLIQINQAI